MEKTVLLSSEEENNVKTPESYVDSLERKVVEQSKVIDQLKDEALYKRAEFDNFRKRTIKEKENIRQTATKSLMCDLLEVLDDFNRAESYEPFSEGLKMVVDKLKKKLTDNGLEKIDTTNGTDFDENVAEAISVIDVEDDTLHGKIVDTVASGYKLNGNIIRYAKVVVGE